MIRRYFSMLKHWIIPAILLAVLGGAYLKYGYLIRSFRNFAPVTKVTDEKPVILTPAESDPSLSYLKLPEGFSISYFSHDVPGARSLAVGDNGVVYVGTRPEGVVYALEDTNKDGRADTRYIVASGLNNPNGIVYDQGTLYVAEIGKISKFPGIDGTFKNHPPAETVYANLPKLTHHGWRYMKIGPDGKLYVGIGAPCNECAISDPFGSIVRLNTDGTGFEVFERGIRNTVGFDWNPLDKTLWFTENGRDNLGNNIPEDELNRAGGGNLDFGFPYCHQGDILDPQFGKNKKCGDSVPPALKLGPHVAALGMHFYRGSAFPPEYAHKILIAEHGSWNRTDPIGYRVISVDIAGIEASNPQEFISGWLDKDGNALGRPVDVLELADGSILVSDDKSGAVYRVTYTPVVR